VCSSDLHGVDARTGKACWTHDAEGEIWSSTLVADGKVYAGTRRGVLWVLAASRERKVIGRVQLDSSIAGTPVAANGVLYITTERKLYAFQKQGGASPK
jgi:outer membrane protein assembly factor BamB